MHNLIVNSIWSDIRISSSGKRNEISKEVTTILNKPAIVEATGFIRNQDGEIVGHANTNNGRNPKNHYFW